MCSIPEENFKQIFKKLSLYLSFSGSSTVKAKVPDTTMNFDDSDSDSDESSDEEQEESIASTSAFTPKESIIKDLCLYHETHYEKLYTWLYFSQAYHRYMCKTYKVFLWEKLHAESKWERNLVT